MQNIAVALPRLDTSDRPFGLPAPVELHLPYPVSANDMWTHGFKGTKLSGKYKQWLHDAGFLALAQRAGSVKGPYRLGIYAVRPNKCKRDLDNIIKPISDLLVSIGSVTDDSLCQEISARWVKSGDGVRVTIEPVAA